MVLPSFLSTFVGPELRRELLSPVTGQDIWDRLAPWIAHQANHGNDVLPISQKIHWDYTLSHCDIVHKLMNMW